MSPRISIIIPILNSLSIGTTLRAIRDQQFDLSTCEVLVVGLDGPGIVEEDSLVRHIDTGEAYGAARNRNIGMGEANGDIICFTDSDCIPHPDWLYRLTAPFANSCVGVVGGGIVFDTDNYWTWCDNISWFYQVQADAPAGTRLQLPTLNLAVRRDVVDSVGLLNDVYVYAGDDIEWTTRMRSMGYRLDFEPRAIVKHDHTRSSLRQLWRHGYTYGRYSPKFFLRDRRTESSLERFLLPRRRISILAMTPLLSLLAAVRAVHAFRGQRGYWKSMPGVWLSKIAWCIGAASNPAHPYLLNELPSQTDGK